MGTNPPTTMPPNVCQGSVLTVIKRSVSLVLFVDLVGRAQIPNMLDSPSWNFTVFAPNDKAFHAPLSVSLVELIKRTHASSPCVAKTTVDVQIDALVKTHIVQGYFPIERMHTGLVLKTISGLK